MSNPTENVVAVATVETSTESVTLAERIKKAWQKLSEIRKQLESKKDFTKAELNAFYKSIENIRLEIFLSPEVYGSKQKEIVIDSIPHEVDFDGVLGDPYHGRFTRYEYLYTDGTTELFRFYNNERLIKYNHETDMLGDLLKSKYDSVKF